MSGIKIHKAVLVGLTAMLSLGCVLVGSNRSATSYTAMVPMPDGVKLAATVYLPQDSTELWSTILIRTPYGRTREEFVEYGQSTISMGIAVVIQDQRGRYDSEGEDVSFFADKIDGPATIDWIVAQSWSNGRVATEGGSAMGIIQYMMAPGASSALTCQWIEVATPDLYMEGIYQGGVYRHEMVNGWLDEINSLHLVEPWQTNTLNSSYWDAVQIVDDYAKVHTPAFHIGGYYDVFARGIIDGFLGYQNQGGEGAAGHQHLVLGPWVHAINDPRAGELTFGQAVLGELYDEWQPMWFEACLGRSADIGRLDALATVTYFVMGAVGENDAPGNEWRTASTWPPEGYEETRVYLYSGNTLTTELPGEDSGGDTFAYDPIDPAPTICGRTMQIEAGSCDQRPVEGRDDVLVYTSTALEEPLEVTGDVRAEIWFTTDVLDTDIVVRLTDVYPDGRSMLIVDGIVRARYHNSPDFAAFELLETDRPYPVTLDLGPTSIILNKGHRLRVSVTSSNWPCFSVNPNTGESFLLEGEQGRIAHTTILHDAAHPSAIVLPVK